MISPFTERKFAPARALTQSFKSFGSLTGVGVCCLVDMLTSMKCLRILDSIRLLESIRLFAKIYKDSYARAMSNQPAPYPIRMPEELRDVLAERAREGGRSLHAEIIGILQDAVDGATVTGRNMDLEVFAEAVASRVLAKLKAD